MSVEAYVQSSQIPKRDPIQFSLTQDQYVFIQSFLPRGFSLQEFKKIQRRQKKEGNKLLDAETKREASFLEDDTFASKNKRNKPKKIDRFLQQQQPRPKIKYVPVVEKLSDEQMNKCFQILNQLKKHASAWPFIDPVNPKELGIPDYFDVIKEPMDLSTIEKNLKTNQYQSINQFHGDINKIWLNSYRYNQKGSEVYKVTIDMQKYYKKITAKSQQVPIETNKIVVTKKPEKQLPPAKIPKAKPQNHSPVISTNQKRQLCQDIKKLSQDNLMGIWQIVGGKKDQSQVQFDIDKLDNKVILKLQEYVRQKQSKIIKLNNKVQKKTPEKRVIESHKNDEYVQRHNQERSAQSSQILDSDQQKSQ